MHKSFGECSILFGIAADRYERKWPFVVNNVLFIILEMSTGFTKTYSEFLATRALFGIAMGVFTETLPRQHSTTQKMPVVSSQV